MGAYFRLFKDSFGYFRFNLHTPSGEKILLSERYPTKDGCRNGISSVKTDSTSIDNFETYKDIAGKLRFRLHARIGEFIGHSKAYKSIGGRTAGITSVMLNAPVAGTRDLPIKQH